MGLEEMDFTQVQWHLAVSYLSPELKAAVESAAGNQSPGDRPIFVPHVLLVLLRLAVTYCEGVSTSNEISPHLHFELGRLCLILNGLMFSEDELRDHIGLEDDARSELTMVQMAAPFEAQNTSPAGHLYHRVQVMYRMLLGQDVVRNDIATRCAGFNFEAAFRNATGITIERWLFIMTAIYSYYLQGAASQGQDTTYVALNTENFVGVSQISKSELVRVLESISNPISFLRSEDEVARAADYRHDLITFRSKPLIRIETTSYICSDISFLLEKCHVGLLWEIHQSLESKQERDLLFNAWGVLFEHYVAWLLCGSKTKLEMACFSPTFFADNGHEAFDGVVLTNSILVAEECKGGLLARDAKYSLDSARFKEELEKKIGRGVKQLARKIGELFNVSDRERRKLRDIPLHQVKVVIPILIVQDTILRGPLINWYLNRVFQTHLEEENVTSEVMVRPLTLLHIQDVEVIVNALEASDFDFVYALHNRAVRDPLMKTDLSDHLRSLGSSQEDSARSVEIRTAFFEPLMGYLFPGEKANS